MIKANIPFLLYRPTRFLAKNPINCLQHFRAPRKNISLFCPSFILFNMSNQSDPRGSVFSMLRQQPLKLPEHIENQIESIAEKIKQIVKEHDIVVFLKGSPFGPACRFSDAVIQVFSHPYFHPYRLTVHFVDVSQDEILREASKRAAQWPTIPQIYISGEFIGGCDILLELANSDELSHILKVLAEKRGFTPTSPGEPTQWVPLSIKSS